MSQRYFCPVTSTSRLIAKKWHPVILERLMGGSRRFSEIRVSIPAISGKVLSECLEDLERVGLVTRTVKAARPVRITYDLTDRGADLQEVIEGMKAWGNRWLHPGPPKPRATLRT